MPIFPSEPGLAGFIGAGRWIGSGGDNWSYKMCKSSPTQPTPNFLQARCPSCCQTNSVKALKGKMTETVNRFDHCVGDCLAVVCVLMNVDLVVVVHCALSVVCAVRVIAECDIMQDFLASPDDNIVSCELILRFSFLPSLYFVA